jgi:hypothetical protein
MRGFISSTTLRRKKRADAGSAGLNAARWQPRRIAPTADTPHRWEATRPSPDTRLPESASTATKVRGCRDIGWVCETHDDLPWDGEHACGCGAAGMPCPACNPSDKDHPPRLPGGFQRDETLDDE